MRKCILNILRTVIIFLPTLASPAIKQSATLKEYQKSLEIIKNDTTFQQSMLDCSETFLKRVKLWRFILGEADDSTKYVYNWKSSELLGSFEIPDAVYKNNRAIQGALIRKVLVSYCLKIADSLEALRNESLEDCPWCPEDGDIRIVDSINASSERSLSILDSIIEEQQQFLAIIKGKKKLIEDTFKRMPLYLVNIVKVLLEANLSPSLALAVGLESRYIDTIESHKGAVGLYQFMPETGRDFNLIINNVIDERYSEYHSRTAFIKYMTFLNNKYPEFPFISLLSYFTGPKYHRDLYVDSLDQCDIIADSLPFASSNYIPSIVALRDIFLERIDKIMEYSMFPEIKKKIILSTGINAKHLPSLFGCSEEDLLTINKQFRHGFIDYILPANYTFFLPVDKDYIKTQKSWFDVISLISTPTTYPPFYASLEIVYSFLKMEPANLYKLP